MRGCLEIITADTPSLWKANRNITQTKHTGLGRHAGVRCFVCYSLRITEVKEWDFEMCFAARSGRRVIPP